MFGLSDGASKDLLFGRGRIASSKRLKDQWASFGVVRESKKPTKQGSIQRKRQCCLNGVDQQKRKSPRQDALKIFVEETNRPPKGKPSFYKIAAEKKSPPGGGGSPRNTTAAQWWKLKDGNVSQGLKKLKRISSGKRC